MPQTIIGFVVSDPAGNYDPTILHRRTEAERIVDHKNANLTKQERFEQGSWGLGAVFDDGEVDFSCC